MGVLTWCSWMIARGCARSISNEFFTVGHTHNVCDQRFSVVAKVLKASPVLQNLNDFSQAIENGVNPTGNRVLKCETLHGVHNWKQFFAPLGLEVAGLVSTKHEPEANHSWRLLRRADLVQYVQPTSSWVLEVPEEPS